jgi:uncharacterized protein (DUF2062 family)
MTRIASSSRLKNFWQERVIALVAAQFTQGFTPQKIALTIALGFSLGIFPILGATTILCATAGIWLKLNQPVIQLVNWIASPLQLTLILAFVRMGEWMMRAQRASFSVPEMLRRFRASPERFLHDFGLTGLHGIVAWIVVAPFLAVAIYFTLLPPLKALKKARE